MSDLLIPFGIHRDTGEIIEPEDAPKGRACNCICPGCKAPLLSRHPEEKRYHFAHDSRHEDARPEEECPLSSAVAVAMMVREVAASSVGKFLETPPLMVYAHYECCGEEKVIRVTKGSRNEIERAHSGERFYGHHVDMIIRIGSYTILVDLVYKGKQSISYDEQELQRYKAGLLELNCDSFSITKLKTDRTLRFSEAVLLFLLEDGYREWRFHPRTASKKQSDRQTHQCKRSKQFTYSQTQTYGFTPGISRPDRKPVRYFCVQCGVEWTHDFSEQLGCPECSSHLYARELG